MKAANWFKTGLLNLMIVALYGVAMRYKIAFDFPYLDQRNLLHAHSHFAFSAWISHFLYTGLLLILQAALPGKKLRIYNLLIAVNLLSAYGMLISFTMQGYKVASICFSTLSIIIAAIFAWNFIRDAPHLPRQDARPWAVAGLLLNVMAAAGPFYLAYMVASKNIHHELYLGSVYYYLHFQYNGWFFFCSVAIALHLFPSLQFLKKYFLPFVITVIPTFFLSILWAKLPVWLYTITVASTAVQLIAWLGIIQELYRIGKQKSITWRAVFFYAAMIAITIKFILQTVSVIPSLSQLVFGFRPIVIAYLHLVLLGGYSLFIIAYLLKKKYIRPSSGARNAAFLFLSGVVLNELLLTVQGIGAFSYIAIPYINELLFVASVVLLMGAAWICLSPFNHRIDDQQ